MLTNLFSKFLSDERGDVVQYIIVLAVIAIILAFAWPIIRDMMSDGMDSTTDNVGDAFQSMDEAGHGNVGWD